MLLEQHYRQIIFLKSNSALLQQDFISYWEILLCILILLIVTPFFYIGYLKRLKIKEKYKQYHFEGEYNANKINEIVVYVENLEIFFGKKFPGFKNLLLQFENDPTEDKRMHVEVIESILFCIKLNGQKRWKVFWGLSDNFLKVMILMLPIIGVLIVIISKFYFDLTGLVFSIIGTIISLPIILIIFSYFLKTTQNIFRKRGNKLPTLSLAYFVLDALINSNVSRAFDKKTKTYYYYTTIHKYNNLVYAKFGFGSSNIRSASTILGELKELALGEK